MNTHLSRTAVYLGEPVVYTIELHCAPGVDALMEDLQRERFQIEGGEIARIDTQHDDIGGQIVRRVEVTLVSFNVEASEIRVAPLRVRYYTRGPSGAASETAPAGEVEVPGATVALRSTIADWEGVPRPRVPLTTDDLPDRVRLAPAIGWILVALAALPLLLWGATTFVDLRSSLARLASARARRKRFSIAEWHHLDPRSDSERVDAFVRLDRAVRDHLAGTAGIPAQALTPREVGEALRDTRSTVPADLVVELLERAQRARYAPTPPTSDDWAVALSTAEQVFKG